MDQRLLAESVLPFLRRWADAIAARDLDSLEQVFAENAVFIGTAPAPLLGRAAIRRYYAAAPKGLKVQARVALVAPQPEGLSIVAEAAFFVPGADTLFGRLSLACTASQQITLYHLTPRVGSS